MYFLGALLPGVFVQSALGALFTHIGVQHMKRLAILILTGFLMVVASNTASAQTKYTFKKGQLVSYKGKPCGLISNKWTPVKKSSGKSYVIDNSSKTRCRGLLASTALKKNGLGRLPKASALLKSRSNGASVSDPNGTPPVLKDIPDFPGGVKNLFWGSGVVDAIANGTADPQQCSEFFVGSTDGTSSGLLGCFSAQGVGYSFQSVLQGSNSSCFIKNIASQSLLDAGAITVTDGSLPSGGIANLFSPGATDRTVKIQIGGLGMGQNGFVKVDSAGKLANAGRQYGLTSYFCMTGQPTPMGKERMNVSLSGKYDYTAEFGAGPANFSTTISAQLSGSGTSVQFDTTQNRTSQSQADLSGGVSFKSLVTITPENLIKTKVYDFFGAGGRKNYAISEFSGTGLSDFRLIQSALKDNFGGQDRQGGFEYRGSVGKYVSAPGNALVDDLSEVNFSTDSFYSTPASVSPDFSDTSCSADADVTLTINFGNPALMTVAQACQAEALEDMNFCMADSTVMAAFAAFPTTCGL